MQKKHRIHVWYVLVAIWGVVLLHDIPLHGLAAFVDEYRGKPLLLFYMTST